MLLIILLDKIIIIQSNLKNPKMNQITIARNLGRSLKCDS